MRLLDEMIRSFENIGYGIGLSIIVAAVLLLVIYAIRKGNQISPFTFLIAVILIPLLSLQFSLMFGAISVQVKVNNVEKSINAYTQLLSSDDSVSEYMDDVYAFIDKFQSLVPAFSPEMGSLPLGQIDKNDVGGSLLAPAKSYLKKFISHKILWSVLFTVIAMVGMILLSDIGVSHRTRRSSVRGERVSSRRDSYGRRSGRRSRRY